MGESMYWLGWAGIWKMIMDCWVLSLVLAVLLIVARWKIYEKAGEEGWKSLIPFYNTYIMFKIIWGNGWLFLLELIPIVNIVISIICTIKLSKAFGQGGAFAVGLIFLPNIFELILGFGNYTYIGPRRG